MAVTFTILRQQAAGLVRADKDEPSPTTSITYMNYTATGNQSNTGVVAVAANGKIQFTTNSATDLLIEVQGYYTADTSGPAPGGYVPITPKRVIDTRNGTGLPKAPLAAGTSTALKIATLANLPSGASGAMLNFTVANYTATGNTYFRAYPSDDTAPYPGFNIAKGVSDTTMAQIGLSAAGAGSTPAGSVNFDLPSTGYTLDLVVEVVGYFAPGRSSGTFTPGQTRVWDSRTTGHNPIASGATAKIQVAGVNGIPQAGSGISAITANLAAVSSGTKTGILTVWADGTARPTLASVLYQPNVIVSNMSTSALGSNGAVDVYNSGPDPIDFVLDVEGWYTNVGVAISNGQTETQQSVTLQADPNGGGNWVSYQYRVGTTANFTSVPPANLKDSDGNQPSGTTSQKANGSFPAYTWNVRDTLAVGNVPAPDSLVQVQACYGTSSSDSNPACGMPLSVTFSQTDGGDASAEVGPGTVSELTGDFQLSETDANAATALGSLNVGRTLSTLKPAAVAGAGGVFGPGWTASLADGGAGAGDLTVTRDGSDGTVLFADTDGTVSVYQTNDSPSSYPVAYVGAGDNAGDGVAVTKTNASTITLTEGDGTTTTWTKSGSTWSVASVKQPGSNSTTTFTYNSAGLVTRVVAPAPSGVSCTNPDTTPGCRSLVLNYASVPTGSGTATRLTSVALSIPQNAGSANTVTVASYDYDSSGRLARAWDPRISPALKTAYGYDAANRLVSLTPPGQAAWTLAYDSRNRLSTASRPDPSGSTATTTVVYDVGIGAGDGSARPDVTATATGTWGQTDDLPVTGTAIFDPRRVPSATPSAADWPYASIDYQDVNGRTVNHAVYGAGDWQIGTTQFDSSGNEVWNLTPGNRAQARTTTGDTDGYVAGRTSNVDRAALLTSTTTYDPLNPGRATDTFGPTHPVTLTDGTVVHARTHVATAYDEGAPNAGVNPATNQPYGLPTSVTTTAWQPGTATDSGWPDLQVTRTGYDAVASGDTSGWPLGTATTSTVQMEASPSNSDLSTYTRFDANGRVLEQRLPGDGGGSGPRTTTKAYYTATGSGGCADPTRVGLLCRTAPAGQPGTGSPLPVVTYGYDAYGKQTSRTETFGTGSSPTVRTGTVTYDAAERPVTSSTTVTPTSAGGIAVPSVTAGYATATGLPTTVSTTTGGTTTTLTTAYDTLGRPSSYTDATGVRSTTDYDLAGHALHAADGKRTATNTTDSATEHRGLLTGEDIGATSAPSAFAASYDAAGNLAVETYPNGLKATRRYDNAGNLTSLVYGKSGSTWMTFTQDVNALGQIAAQTSPQSSQRFTYDPADRLRTVQDTYNNTCVTRDYEYDDRSNRTAQIDFPATTNGSCTTDTESSATTYKYDAADRLTSDSSYYGPNNYTYDTLGRSTTVPAADAQGIGSHTSTTGNLTVGYTANDMVASQAQGSATVGFTLDPSQNRIATKTEGAATSTNHYANGGDSPSWTALQSGSSTTWTDYIAGPSGGLAATLDQTGDVTFTLTNPHGDIVARSADSSAATGVTGYGESTEFGVPRSSPTANDTYGWVGASQRSVDDLGGLTLMGVRLYNPESGRFLSADPVPGGNANAYVYPPNPITDFDVSGQFHRVCGNITCTFYLSKTECENLADYGAVVGTFIGIAIGGPVGGLIGVAIGIHVAFIAHGLRKHRLTLVRWGVLYPFGLFEHYKSRKKIKW